MRGIDMARRQDAEPIAPVLHLPGMASGTFRVTVWDTRQARAIHEEHVDHRGEHWLRVQLPPFGADVAVAVRRAGA